MLRPKNITEHGNYEILVLFFCLVGTSSKNILTKMNWMQFNNHVTDIFWRLLSFSHVIFILLRM